MTRPRPQLLRAYDEAAPSSEETETATFALGCFWGPDAEFGAREGVVRTRVGYAGGTDPDPTYHALGDHSEAVQVEYDPGKCSYEELLAVAFRSHDHRSQPRKRQYQHVVFTETAEQHETLEAFLAERGLEAAGIATRIEELSAFHLAEPYHQKYNLKNKRWVTEAFEEAGYDTGEIRESPAAAVLNAHVAGREVDAPELLDDQPVRE